MIITPFVFALSERVGLKSGALTSVILLYVTLLLSTDVILILLRPLF